MGYKDYDNSLYEYRARLAKIKGRRWNLIFRIKDDRISVRANPYHDPTNGRFTSRGGAGPTGGKTAIEKAKDYRMYSEAVAEGDISPLVNYKTYDSISREIDKKLVGQKTENGLKITGKSHHFVARTIGSVEQKRSGVAVEDALDALQNPLKKGPIIEADNGKSQRFIGKRASVTINPDTGVLIQTNPKRKGRTGNV